MDQFKKYLREHRNELDVEIPPPSQKWQQNKGIKQSVTVTLVRWMAASILILVSSILYLLFLKPDNHVESQNQIVNADSNQIQQRFDSVRNDPSLTVNDSDKTTLQEVTLHAPESKKDMVAKQTQTSPKSKKSKSKSSPLQSLETNYATIINYQLKRVERTPIYAESPDYFHVFKKQWYDLEKDEEKIKRDIQMYGLKDIVVDQFIQLYQNKIGLLKQLQTEIDKMNLRVRRQPGFVNQTPTYLKM